MIGVLRLSVIAFFASLRAPRIVWSSSWVSRKDAKDRKDAKIFWSYFVETDLAGPHP